MKIYFSGWGGEHRPTGLKQRPNFMLTFYDLNRGVKKQVRLLNKFVKRKQKRKVKKQYKHWSDDPKNQGIS